MALQQPLDGLERHAWRRPRRSITRRNLPGISEAGFHGGGWLTVDHHYFKAGPGQIISTGDTDDATAQYQNSHVYVSQSQPAADVCGST